MFRFLYSYLALREAVVVQGHKSNDFIIQDDSRQCLPRIYGMYSLKYQQHLAAMLLSDSKVRKPFDKLL